MQEIKLFLSRIFCWFGRHDKQTVREIEEYNLRMVKCNRCYRGWMEHINKP